MSFLTPDDSAIFYDLKQMLQDCNMQVPPELARHEAARVKPGTIGHAPKPKIQFAKK